jgi:ABC-type phosphate transport system substrate-binding protein
MRRIPSLLVMLALAASATATHAAPGNELYMVVNARNPIQGLAMRDAVALYTGRVHTFPDGREAEAFDQSDTGGTRASFYRALTGMDLARINSYWARLRFSGQVQPPRSLGDDRDILAMIKSNPRAIGYLRTAPADASVRVVLVLADAAE